MGKAKDSIDWLKDKAEKVKDTFGTGIEALNPKGLADKIFNDKMKW
jgi:hypothetical protein